MAEASLEDRLRGHAKAFDGLMSLIPAKMYYGEDTSDQWKKTKQTKKEAAAARRAKLDPDSELNRNAKEVMDERAKNKRKLRQMQHDQDQADEDEQVYEPVEGVEPEQPGQGLKKKTAEPNKKQKVAQDDTDALPEATEEQLHVPAEDETKEEKKSKRDAKKEKKREKMAEKKAKKTDQPPATDTDDTPLVDAPPPDKPSKKQKGKKAAKNADDLPPPQVEEDAEATTDAEQTSSGHADPTPAPTLDPKLDFTRLQNGDEESSASMPDSEPQSPTFDTPVTDAAAEPARTTTSISSTIPPSEKPKHIKIPADTSALKERLAAKIAALRAARKADGPDGKPIRTRQELIESRRFKADQRKAHKKELRKQAMIEEDRKREEALASNSPSVMSPGVELDEATGNFAFGRVAFEDGTQLSHDLSYILQGKKKGPSDPKTALLKVQNQNKRLEELDDETRKDIAEKESWLTARRRVTGEKVRDDETMLKKAIKRKEVAKKKSEKAWQERAAGIGQAQKEKQRKREENLKKRREGKGVKGKKKSKGGAKKKGGRPGFEGSLGVGGRKK